MNEATQILLQIHNGDTSAAEQLLPLVYDELRKLAEAKLAQEKPGQTLQATALVHDAYIRLVDVAKVQHWNSRGHFFAAAAEAMRRILVENARRKQSRKRGGGVQQVDLNPDHLGLGDSEPDLLALDEALARFEDRWPDKAQLVKLRYFVGLTIPESADALGISHATAERHWTFARAWLYAQLHDGV